MNLCLKTYIHKRFIRLSATSVLYCGCSGLAVAQEAPPRPIIIYVNPAQGLNFGTFSHGPSGGTVIIYPNGTRSVTGDIVQLSAGIPFSPAIFEVEANPGTVVSIVNGPDVLLTGSNGGTMALHIGSSSTGSPFISNVAPPGRTEVRIGGTLLVGSPLANPGGAYSGSFMVTFIQE
jgi:Domain of unknown function (DUF4402)